MARSRPATWWTSLTLTQARRAVGLSGLRTVQIDGDEYVADHEPEPVGVPRAMLLSNFDELISYVRDPVDLELLGGDRDAFMRASGLLFVDGRLSGSWTRALRASDATITVRPAVPIRAPVRQAIESEAEAFGRFCDRTPTLAVIPEPA